MVWGNLFSIKMMRRETDKLEFTELGKGIFERFYPHLFLSR